MVKRIVKEEKNQAVSGLSGFMGADPKNKKIIKRFKDDTNYRNWWLEEPKKLYASVDAAVSMLETAQTTRRMLNIKFARLYSNMEALGFPYQSLGNNSAAQDNTSSNKITINVIQNIIDTAGSKIAKDQPKVSVVTTGANDYFLKLRAEGLTKYLSGSFKASGVYENAELVFRDACVNGTGFLRIFEEDDKIKTEWCYADEIRIDELDGLKGKPRSMHRVFLVPRDQLVYEYPEYENEILSAVSAMQGKIGVQSTTEMVRCTESWHLPSKENKRSKKAKKPEDGMWCITIENCTLDWKKYTKKYFPIVPYRWMNRPLGYFGRSITEEIMTIQVEINKILRTIQQSQELAAVPMVFVPSGAEIAEDVLLSNVIARMIPYSGPNPPSWFTPTAQNAETYNHLAFLIQKAYETVGISAASATGQKPAGVDSAVAMREVQDIESGRFSMAAKRWEQWFVDIARIQIDMSKDLYDRNKDLSVIYKDKKILREVKWGSVDLENNPFDLQTFPTSQLPDTPAGRIQTISEYIQQNWISKERGMELLNLDPDLEQEVNMQTASLRLTEKWLSEMVEDGKYHQPDPHMNLPLAQSVSLGVYNMLLHDNCPEDRLNLVRNFINKLVEMQKPPPAPPQPAAPPGQPMPGAAPAPGPQPPMPPAPIQQ